jgi:Leucine-rich repeat (LRR) protein
MMVAPHNNKMMDRVQRSQQLWKTVALSTLFVLVVLVMGAATVAVIEKRQQDRAEAANAVEPPGRRLEDEKGQRGNRDKDYLEKKVIPQKPDPDLAALRKLGGQIQRDSKLPDKPVVALSLFGTRVGDEDLAHLHTLPQLRDLDLGETNITDEALTHLKSLTHLQKLDLRGTRITDKGLAFLRGLSELRELDLFRTQVTNLGLQHLKGLFQLQTLNLFRTQVTEAGIKELQGSLPAVKIEH